MYKQELANAIDNGYLQIEYPAFFENNIKVHHAVLIGEIEDATGDVYFYAHDTDRSPTEDRKGFKSVLKNEDIYIFYNSQE